MLYEEMESSLASIYEVVGYFDIKPNDVFPPNVLIVVVLMVSLNLCPDTQESSMFFVLCQWRRDAIIFL